MLQRLDTLQMKQAPKWPGSSQNPQTFPLFNIAPIEIPRSFSIHWLLQGGGLNEGEMNKRPF